MSDSREEELFLNTVLKLNFPLQNVAFIQSYSIEGCWGGLREYKLIFASKDKLFIINFYKNNGRPACWSYPSWGPDVLKYFSETRYLTAPKALFFSIKVPSCIFQDSETEPKQVEREGTDVANEIFARIDLSGDKPKQTIYYNRGIPNKFLNEWNQAKVAVD